jgi:hypothetical protein
MAEGGPMGALRLPWPGLIAVTLCAALLRAAAIVPRIEVVEGDGAINNIRLHRAKEPVVRVVDQEGHPLENVAVTFVLPEQGASATFTGGRSTLTVMTDAQGRAVGVGLHPNNSAGQFRITVTASYQGQAATASLVETNAEPAQGGSSSRTLLLVALVGGGVAAAAALALGKGKSSSTSTSTSSTGAIITPGSPSFGPPK